MVAMLMMPMHPATHDDGLHRHAPGDKRGKEDDIAKGKPKGENEENGDEEAEKQKQNKQEDEKSELPTPPPVEGKDEEKPDQVKEPANDAELLNNPEVGDFYITFLGITIGQPQPTSSSLDKTLPKPPPPPPTAAPTPAPQQPPPPPDPPGTPLPTLAPPQHSKPVPPSSPPRTTFSVPSNLVYPDANAGGNWDSSGSSVSVDVGYSDGPVPAQAGGSAVSGAVGGAVGSVGGSGTGLAAGVLTAITQETGANPANSKNGGSTTATGRAGKPGGASPTVGGVGGAPDAAGAGEKKGLSGGVVAGIVFAFLFALVAIFYILYRIMRKRRRDQDRSSISTDYVFEGFEGSGATEVKDSGASDLQRKGTQYSALEFSDGPLPRHEQPGNWKHMPVVTSPFDDPPEAISIGAGFAGIGGLAAAGADAANVIVPHTSAYARSESDVDHSAPVMDAERDGGHISVSDTDVWLPLDHEAGVTTAAGPGAAVSYGPSSWAAAAVASMSRGRGSFIPRSSIRSSVQSSGQSSAATAGMTEHGAISARSSFNASPPTRTAHLSTRSYASTSTYPMPTANTDFTAVYDAYGEEPKPPVFTRILGGMRDKPDGAAAAGAVAVSPLPASPNPANIGLPPSPSDSSSVGPPIVL